MKYTTLWKPFHSCSLDDNFQNVYNKSKINYETNCNKKHNLLL